MSEIPDQDDKLPKRLVRLLKQKLRGLFILLMTIIIAIIPLPVPVDTPQPATVYEMKTEKVYDMSQNQRDEALIIDSEAGDTIGPEETRFHILGDLEKMETRFSIVKEEAAEIIANFAWEEHVVPIGVGLMTTVLATRAKLKSENRKAALKELDQKIACWRECLSKEEVQLYLKYKEDGLFRTGTPPNHYSLSCCLKTVREDLEEWRVKHHKTFPQDVEDEINKFLVSVNNENISNIGLAPLQRSLGNLVISFSESTDLFKVMKEDIPKPETLLTLINLLIDLVSQK